MGKHFHADFTLAVLNIMPVRIFFFFFLIPDLQQLLVICQLLLNLVKEYTKQIFGINRLLGRYKNPANVLSFHVAGIEIFHEKIVKSDLTLALQLYLAQENEKKKKMHFKLIYWHKLSEKVMLLYYYSH